MSSTQTITALVPTIPAHDLDGLVGFYKSALGLEEDTEYPSVPDGVLLRAGEGQRILVYKTEAARGEHTLVSFLVRDLKGVVSDLRSKGVEFEEFDLPGAPPWADGILEDENYLSAWFRDPEGSFINLMEYK